MELVQAASQLAHLLLHRNSISNIQLESVGAVFRGRFEDSDGHEATVANREATRDSGSTAAVEAT